MENLSEKSRKSIILHDKYFNDFHKKANALSNFIKAGGVSVNNLMVEFNKRNNFNSEDSPLLRSIGKKVDQSRWLIMSFDGSALSKYKIIICNDNTQKQIKISMFDRSEFRISVLEKEEGVEDDTFKVAHITKNSAEFSIINEELTEDILDICLNALNNALDIIDELFLLVSKEREEKVKRVLINLI